MDFYTAFILACMVGFVVSAVDYWIELGFTRAIIALAVSLVGAYLLIGPDWLSLPVLGVGSAFLGLGLIQLVERINFAASRIR